MVSALSVTRMPGAESVLTVIRYREKAFWKPAVPNVTCVDTTGAGDSFVAGFLCGLSKGLALEACVELANQCGAKAVQKIGATSWITEGI